jgi:uncharacterized membrane protein
MALSAPATPALHAKAQLDAEDPGNAGARHRHFVSSAARALLLIATGLNAASLCAELVTWQILRLPGPVLALSPIVPTLLGMIALMVIFARAGRNESRPRIRADIGTGSGRGATVQHAAAVNRDDDRYWLGGILYLNRDDPSFLVPQRFGLGWTVNLGRPAGMAVAAVIAVMALVPVLGPLPAAIH